MFDILMYLFETYIHSDAELLVDQDELTDELSRAGFHDDEIYKALQWLERLAELQESGEHPYLLTNSQHALRIYTQEEDKKIGVQGRGFLLFLEQVQVLSPETREMVLDRVMELDHDEIELEDLKWVVLMVLFNAPGNESAYQQMEDLLFEVAEGPLH